MPVNRGPDRGGMQSSCHVAEAEAIVTKIALADWQGLRPGEGQRTS
jgi:hypothetical protein